jgi:hypothetical protein
LHALSVFGPKKVIEFFEKFRLKTKVERGGRVFPESDSSGDVLRVLTKYITKAGVKVMEGKVVNRIEKKGNKIVCVTLEDGEKISADKFIIATGGKAYPGLGSSGDGFKWALDLGHSISEPRPALAPIKVKEKWPETLQGLSLKNVSLNVFYDGKKKESRFGEFLFAHFGITGPIVLDISKRVGEFLSKKGEVKIALDLKPALDFDTLDKRIQRDFEKFSNKQFKNSLGDLLPRKLIEVIINLSKIDGEKTVNKITKEERQRLARLLKGVELTPVSLLGFDRAIITSGGIPLKEIDAKTMRSKIINNLYFAGEIIDLDGPTGGYNLQICWSSGYLAGESAAKEVKEK